MTGSTFTPMYTQSQEDRRKMKMEDTRRSLLNEAAALNVAAQTWVVGPYHPGETVSVPICA